ncbi:MAG: hypothetical protein WBC05_01345 [Sedimentisphaerales bacterium]
MKLLIDTSGVFKIIPIIALIVAVVGAILAYLRYQYTRKKAKCEKSEQEFKDCRRYLSRNRQELVRDILAALYKNHELEPNIPLLFNDRWFPKKPLPLQGVEIALHNHEESTYTPLNCEKILPYANIWNRYSKYSDAIREIDQPQLFTDLVSYRLMGIETSKGIMMHFGKCSYFDYINTGEVLCYELARRKFLHEEKKRQKKEFNIKMLSVRDQVRDPFDFQNRAVIPGINTLTICEDQNDLRFYMHSREVGKVAAAMGTFHVVPAGEFQPATDNPHDIKNDFSIWKNIMREYNEEFLNAPTGEQTGKSPDYENEEPYSSLNLALNNGDLRVLFLGVGLDPLSLKAEILTVCIFKQNVFSEIFKKMTGKDNEGILIMGKNNKGIPFTEKNVETYVHDKRILSAAIGCLVLAWHHKDYLFEKKQKNISDQ